MNEKVVGGSGGFVEIHRMKAKINLQLNDVY